MGHPSCLLCVRVTVCLHFTITSYNVGPTTTQTIRSHIGCVVLVRAIVALKWSGVRLGLSAQRKKVPFPLTVFNLTSKQVFSFVA